jgi:hypothetical protein
MTADEIFLGHHDRVDRLLESLRDDASQADAPPTQRSPTPDNTDVTAAIRKGQGTNYGERAQIVTLCVQFLTYLLSQGC